MQTPVLHSALVNLLRSDAFFDYLFESLFPNKYLEQRLQNAILSEDELSDDASAELASIRRKIAQAGLRIRDTLDKMIKSSTTQKYLQESIVTIRDGRYVLPVKIEHKNEISGLVHDTSSSGSTLFIEPVAVVEANNEIKSLEAQKRDYCFQLQNALDRQRRMKKVIDIIAYNEYQDICDKVNNLKENVSRLNSEILKAKARKAELVAQMTQSEAEFKTQKFENLAQKHKEIKELEANKEQIDFSNKKQRITAPCDGYIDKLMVHTTGGIVTPAQELIALTPVEQPLIIKAQVLNRDVGFIKPGMNVSIKIDTFDFQKYGILNGTLKSISKNSIEDEKLGPVYEVYIQPDTKTFKIDGREEKIATGMTLNAEINIGKRRIIEFFIYPLIKYLDEGMSVR